MNLLLTYLGLIRPKLEYTSTVWDPYLLKDITAIERIQRIAARWVKSNYNWVNSVSSMLRKLQWPTLLIRRLISRLKISLHNLVTLEMPTYITTNHHHLKSNKIPTPSSLQHTYQQPELANYYHNSLKTIHD